MKKIILTTALLIVGAATFAQQKPAIKADTTTGKKDTVFTLRLHKDALQFLLNSMEGFGTLVRRSPDVSALQADEAVKGLTALQTEIYRQVKAQLPEIKDGKRSATSSK